MLIATRARVRVVARIIPQGHPEGHHSSRTFRGASFFKDIPRGIILRGHSEGVECCFQALHCIQMAGAGKAFG